MTELSKEDWMYIYQATTERQQRAAPRKGEPPASKEFRDQCFRIENFLYKKAFRGQADA